MRKIKIIAEAFWKLSLAWLFGLDDEVKAERERRLNHCENCLLRAGNWCDDKKEIVVLDKDRKTTTVKGCGCYLPAKSLSELNEKNNCPLGRW